MKYILLPFIFFTAFGCSHSLGRFPKNESGWIPKQHFIARLFTPSDLTGRLNKPEERSSPLIIGDTIYQGSVRNHFFALSRKSGKMIWKKFIEGGVESNPQYFDGKIYVGANDGHFYCLDAKSGKTIWRYNTETEILSRPLIKGGIVYFLTVKNGLYALKSDTGKWLWYYNKGYSQKISVRGTSSPVFEDGKIYAGFSDGGIAVLNAFDGAVIWSKKLTQGDKFVDIDVTPIVSERRIFVATSDGFVYALNSIDGGIRWKRKFSGANALANDNSRIYFSTHEDVIALDQDDGEEVWRFRFKEGATTDFLLIEDQLIFGTPSSYVYSLATDNGEPIWRYTTDSGLFAQPAFAPESNGRLYLFTRLASLHAIDPFYLLPETE
ncbi:MAG: PQQ-binding-like beta-propeller repeat protein [Deltaproteobacteria bacterium]